MTILLEKLRINYVSLIMVTLSDKPQEATIQSHKALLGTLVEGQETDVFVSASEQVQLEEKTCRQLRLRELLQQYSKNASLIVLSMPIPRKVSFRNFGPFLEDYIFGFISGNRIRSALHVLARDADEGYATVPVGAG